MAQVRCPACGEPIGTLYAARPMIRVHTGDGWSIANDVTVPRPSPFPSAVCQPCGCSIPIDVARTLARHTT